MSKLNLLSFTNILGIISFKTSQHDRTSTVGRTAPEYSYHYLLPQLLSSTLDVSQLLERHCRHQTHSTCDVEPLISPSHTDKSHDGKGKQRRYDHRHNHHILRMLYVLLDAQTLTLNYLPSSQKATCNPAMLIC